LVREGGHEMLPGVFPLLTEKARQLSRFEARIDAGYIKR
jgi:hypothetical protein